MAKNEADTVVARVLRNDLSGGQLAFAPASDLDAGTNPVAVAAGDLNGDGKQDLIAIGGSLTRDAGDLVIRLNHPVTIKTGDLNCDGAVNFADINPFVMYLSSFAVWQQTYATCPPQNGDINGDGQYPSFADINPFVNCLTSGHCP